VLAVAVGGLVIASVVEDMVRRGNQSTEGVRPPTGAERAMRGKLGEEQASVFS